MIEAVLFDIGDTLMHFETSEARKYIEAGARPAYERLREMGYDPPAFGRYARAIRRAFVRAHLWSRTVARREVRTIEVLRRVHARMGIALDAKQTGEVVTTCIRPFERFFSTDPHAVAVVRCLHETGFKLGIVSNTFFPHFAIDEVLDKEGLLAYFPVRIYSSDVGYMKPHPAIFRAALAGLRVAPERSMHIGDLVRKDVKGAARAGIKSVLLRRDGRAPSGRVRPDYVIRELDEVLGLPGIVERADAMACAGQELESLT